MREFLESRVAVPAAVRILLAVVVVVGGLVSAVLGTMLLFRAPPTPAPHPVGAALVAIGMIAFGAGFLWIGLRLMRRKAGSENLLSPAARRRCSFIVAGLAVFMVIGAVEAKNDWFYVTAAGLVLFSYWLFPKESR